MTETPFLLGIDTGGTFTDFVLLHGETLRLHKVLSTPHAPEEAILQGIEALGLRNAITAGQVRIIHGSTVATNAALEGKGARTLFVTQRGLADLLTLGRQARRELYALQPAPVAPPVPAELCLEVGGRMDADGHEIAPLTEDDIATVLAAVSRLQPEAVAVCLLFSHRNLAHEQRLGEALRAHVPTSLSSEVWPASGEYERGIATWLNASLNPRMSGYLERLMAGVAPCPVAIMQSSGGTLDASQARHHAARLLLSGPAGGLAGAHYMAARTGIDSLLTFDMGGTSTDVAFLEGAPGLTHDGRIGPWPVALPMVDLHTIGAGGGSIASLDAGGMLQVGPASAGAFPGPACYGRGGRLPTVTDANAVLGRLRPEFSLGGHLTIDDGAAHEALMPLASAMGVSLEDAAAGIVTLANEHMARALRVISVQRGHDLAQTPLFCFGGAGGLHVCALAEGLGITRVIIPAHGGVYSALGMLVAPRVRQEQQGIHRPLAHVHETDIGAWIERLSAQGRASFHAEGVAADTLTLKVTLGLRYSGQQHSLTLPWKGSLASCEDAFHAAHETRYGHRLSHPVELALVGVRLSAPAAATDLPACAPAHQGQAFATASLPGQAMYVPLWWRDHLAPGTTLTGPVIIGETISTTWVEAGWTARCDALGNLVLERLL